MRKLSEIKGEDALDVLADALGELSVIFGDQNFAKLVRGGASKMDAVKYLLKEHKKEVLTVMAIIEGENPDEYEPTIIEIPVKLLALLNDPDIKLLFPSLETVTSSGSAMENTEATEQS